MSDDLERLEGEFYEDSMTALERKKDLQRTVREADDIEADLAKGGPLGQYVRLRRENAIAGIQRLTSVNPRDAVAITEAQAEVREYLRVCEWITGSMQDAQQAEQALNEENTDAEDQVE